MPSILWKFLTYKGKRTPPGPLGPFRISEQALAKEPAQELQFTWLGHSSYLLELEGTRLLVDPVFSKRASPFPFMGPHRFFPSPVLPQELPPLTAVLLSHDHYDHLDRHLMKYLAKVAPRFICPLGVNKHLEKWGVPADKITILDWGQTIQLGTLTLTSTPARHFSGRWFQRDNTLWSSYVLQGKQRKVFIGGDSGYFPGFKTIGEQFGPFDLTILEIGASDPHWPDIHMGPANALKAHIDLGGKVMLPVHWGTFNLAFHDWDEPGETIIKLAAEKDVTLWLPTPGETGQLPTANKISYWWRNIKH
ncbi:MAG: MBL fold metallo-hydrolase [Chitinophaga sp.]|uniref:MBL fold metallo-hydrolase n=1 Tax=Chitinophaga sp. TaxID=1869181 RepID=UPI0025C1CC16|nr:MBL fold metallo-hydrolase [Chitinophaga sp.]MBV8251127.1 MBL fold metallo-hydrolase [Chitinophaga sp.]